MSNNNFFQTEDYENIKNKILDYLTVSDHSEKKLLLKVLNLKKRFPESKRYKNYTKKNVELVIQRLVELDIINEKRFLTNMLENSLSGIYGLKRIEQKMYQRLYKKENIQEVIKQFVESNQKADLTRIIQLTRRKKNYLERKYANNQNKKKQIREKLIGFLIQKGFSYKDILEILEKIND